MSRGAVLASRVGTLISCVRMVAVVAFACSPDARAPVARVRLKATPANANQTLAS